MLKPETLEKLDETEERISALWEHLYEAELFPPQFDSWARIRRSISIFLVRRYVLRQLQHLYLQRRIIENCRKYNRRREAANVMH
jgi:hypothetical protein